MTMESSSKLFPGSAIGVGVHGEFVACAYYYGPKLMMTVVAGSFEVFAAHLRHGQWLVWLMTGATLEKIRTA
jgi:hypothetical protein